MKGRSKRNGERGRERKGEEEKGAREGEKERRKREYKISTRDTVEEFSIFFVILKFN